MNDDESVAFLQWALPRMGMCWRGFRRVRSQVKKRLVRRIRELGLGGLSAYYDYLLSHPREWDVMHVMCRVTISRFYRDRAVFDAIRLRILPALAARAASNNRTELRVWSAGCASGEEPYSVLLAWKFSCSQLFPGMILEVLATEADANLIDRAHRGIYTRGSLRELPEDWIAAAFDYESGQFSLREDLRSQVEFRLQDLIVQKPEGFFDLILCRNLVLTYFDETRQASVISELAERLVPGGALTVGIHEVVPRGVKDLVPWEGCRVVYRKVSDQTG